VQAGEQDDGWVRRSLELAELQLLVDMQGHVPAARPGLLAAAVSDRAAEETPQQSPQLTPISTDTNLN
jgi:hypothetical protein